VPQLLNAVQRSTATITESGSFCRDATPGQEHILGQPSHVTVPVHVEATRSDVC
jgi:hypothetical protein